MLDEIFLGMHAIWPILLQPTVLQKTRKVSIAAPPKDMEGEDPAKPPPALYRNISNASLESVSLTRVKLTPLNNLLIQSHAEQPKTRQKKQPKALFQNYMYIPDSFLI